MSSFNKDKPMMTKFASVYKKQGRDGRDFFVMPINEFCEILLLPNGRRTGERQAEFNAYIRTKPKPLNFESGANDGCQNQNSDPDAF